MLKIKVCGMKYESNIRTLVKLQPDFIGFIFYPGSPRYIGHKVPKSLYNLIPSSIKKTGVFVNADISEVKETYYSYGLDFVQLSGDEPVDYLKVLHNLNIPIIKSTHIEEEADLEKTISCAPYVELFLFDKKSQVYGGSGQKFSWKILEAYKGDVPFLLSGGIGPEDADTFLSLEHKKLEGLDINSRFELSPGLKNINAIRHFIHSIKGTL